MLLVVVPRAVAIVLLLLADIRLRCLRGLRWRLCRLARRLCERIGIVRIRAGGVGIGTSILIAREVRIVVIRVVGLGGRLVGIRRCTGRCSDRRNGVCTSATNEKAAPRLTLQCRVVSKCGGVGRWKRAEPTF